jgi:hypothetical protein
LPSDFLQCCCLQAALLRNSPIEVEANLAV